jgi:hypothetical protein
MKNFIILLVKFLSVIVAVFIVILIILKPSGKPDADYMSAMIDKHKRADSITKPKIILAGGSNVAFGSNSEMIEREFSVPVVNFAIHAALGIEFILGELENSVNENDIVLISFEYFLETKGDYVLKKHVSDIFPKSSSYYSTDLRSEVSLLFDRVRNRLKKIIKSSAEVHPDLDDKNIYTSNAFNIYGDYTAHLDKKFEGELGGKGILNYQYWDGIEQLNHFSEIAKHKNVKIFYFFPAYLQSEYLKNKTAITKNYNDIINDLNIEIIGKLEDFIYSKDNFYNTVYHLNDKGRTGRTNKLIELLWNNKNFGKAIVEVKR